MRTRSRRWTALAAAFLIPALIPPAPCGSAAAPASSRTAAVLFLNYADPGRPAFDAARLHREAWDEYTAALDTLGYDPVPREALEPFLIKSDS